MSLSSLSDESVLRCHTNMRSMVALGIGVDRHTVLGEQARKRAKTLEDELTRRGIDFEPIVWPE
ncbi:MAG: hypothetical protein WBH00_06720 [Xanthobacteraceae bacterium]